MSFEINAMSIPEIAHALRERQFTCVELAEYFLSRIRKLNTELNAFIYVAEDEVLVQAKVLDCELRAGRDRGLLHGIPISIKDNFHVKGMRTTAGSAYLAQSELQTMDCQIVKNLRAAGANILGKNNMAEFAVGFTSRNETFGNIKNPLNARYTAGGSSGGTAAAVAAGLCVGGIGSDTGGSVRLPASVCGVVGVRPTRGLIDVSGGIQRARSLDIAGPLAKNVGDASILLRAMYGLFLPYDGQSSRFGEDDSRTEQAKEVDAYHLKDKVVALVSSFNTEEADYDVKHQLQETISFLKSKGVSVKEISLTELDNIFESGAVSKLLLYEFYSHMQELLGEDAWSKQLGESVRNDLRAGAEITASQYAHVLGQRDTLIKNLHALFHGIDAIIMPVLPIRTPLLEAKNETFELARKFLIPASYLGWPAVSVPCGHDNNGLPVGVQIVGSYYQEQTVLDLARLVEKNKTSVPCEAA